MSTPICNNNSNTLFLFNQGWHFHSLLHFSFFHFTKNRHPPPKKKKINKPRCTFPQRYKNCWKNKCALNEPRRKHYAGDVKIKKPEKKLSGFSQQSKGLRMLLYSSRHFLKIKDVLIPANAKLLLITYSASILRPSSLM